MMRPLFSLLLSGLLIWVLPACATPLTYSAKEIRGQIVDAETNQPIEGAIIVAQWVLFHIGPGHGGHKSRIHVHETITDRDGNYVIPEWGPKVRPPMTELHHRDPQLSIFKSGYEPMGVSNELVSTVRPDSLRVSDWDGKVIKLKPTKENLEDYALRLSSFYSGLVESMRDKDEWKKYPRMTLAVYNENRRLNTLGLKPGYGPSVPDLEKLDGADRNFLEGLKK